jgi:site-specific DNA-methyltransferase (adenine-specific)
MQLTDKIEITNEDNMQLMARFPDNYFDLAIVDPPYGINRLHSGGMPKSSGFKKWERKDWDSEIPKKEYFMELFRVSKNQIIWGGNYFTEYLHPSQGWVFWFKQKGMTFADGELAWTSFDKATRQYDMSGMGGANRIHPTQKPILLYKWLLDKYAKQGDKILDTHLGSMSIAIACAEYGFELVGCELDTEYYDKGIKRVQNHLLQQKLF